MILATLSVTIAAIVEIQRKNIMRDGHYLQQNLSSEPFNASDLSVMVQIPQFALIGASEVFASITGMDLDNTNVCLSLELICACTMTSIKCGVRCFWGFTII